MPGNLPLFITACADRNVTRYERGNGCSCINGRRTEMIYCWSFWFGAEAFRTGESWVENLKRWGLQKGKGLGVVKISEWRNVVPGWKCLRDVRQLRRTRCGGGFRMNSENCGCLGRTPQLFKHMSSSWCGLNFDHYRVVSIFAYK